MRNSGQASLGFVPQEGLKTRNRGPFFTPRGKASWFLTWDNNRGGSGALEQKECLRGSACSLGGSVYPACS